MKKAVSNKESQTQNKTKTNGNSYIEKLSYDFDDIMSLLKYFNFVLWCSVIWIVLVLQNNPLYIIVKICPEVEAERIWSTQNS